MIYSRLVAEQQRFLPEPFESALRGGLYRALGFVLCAVAALGWLSLLTWSVNDPSPMHATGGPVRNLLGPIGAGISDLMLQMLGVAALAALLAPMLWGVELVVVRRIARLKLKIILLPMAVLMLAGGLSALPKPDGWPLRHGLGGFLGDTLLIVAASIGGLFLPGKAPALAGLVLFSVGIGLIAFCAGLSQKDIWRLMHANWAPKTPSRPADESVAAGPSLARAAPRFSIAPVTEQAGRPAMSFEQALAGGHDSSGVHSPRHSSWLPMPRATEEALPPVVTVTPIRSAELPHEEKIEFEDHEEDGSAADLARRFAPQGAGKAEAPDLPHVAEIQAPRPSLPPPTAGQPAPSPLVYAAPGQRRRSFALPSLTLLKARAASGAAFSRADLAQRAQQLEDVLKDFGIKGEIKEIRPGPVVTVFELEPQRGTKSARVIGLADDIGRSMGLRTLRVGVVPGRNALGIEVPNEKSDTVLLREILETTQFQGSEASLPIAIGKSINGDPVIADLAQMPHLLVAGTTGSGKSVGINAMILSLLYRHSPQHCRMLMIDPKMLELSVYNDIPHLLSPVVTDPIKAVAALNWAVGEMEERYKKMAKLGVRNIDGYNKRLREAKAAGEPLERCVQTGYDPATGKAIYETEALDCEELAYIVIVVDEFADLMLVAGKEIEALVQRLAQMARAAGIHLIMATQRPSVNVITGTIKANFPSRISFKVASKIDSRTILNEQGAEQLLGHGDMLFLASSGSLQRVHGAFVGDEEVEAIAGYLRSTGAPKYVHGVTEVTAASDYHDESDDLPPERHARDLYSEAFDIVKRDRKASASYLQRRLSIGYNRAADLIDRLEAEGVIGPQSSANRREVLVPHPDEDDRFI